MVGYDLDGTLADVDFGQAGVRGLARVYAQANVLYTPRQDFVVLTGRTANAEQRRVTRKWLRDNFGDNFKGVFFYSGGEAAIARGKARAIKRLNLTAYYDDNVKMLELIRAEGVDAELHRVAKRGKY